MTTTTHTSELARLEAKVDELTSQVATLVDTQRMMADLYHSMMPIATKALTMAQEQMGEYEKKGYFDFGREALLLVDRVVTGYTPDDVHQLADNVVRILDVVKTVTQPGALDFAEQVVSAAEDAAEKKPTGVLGLLHATNSDDDVRRGLAVVLEGLRQVGKGVHAVSSPKTATPGKGNASSPMPTMVAGLPGMETLAAKMMKSKMKELEIPDVREMLTIPDDSGAELYGCELAMKMFDLKKEDLVKQVKDVITVGDFYDLADGAQIIFT